MFFYNIPREFQNIDRKKHGKCLYERLPYDMLAI